MSVSYFFSKTVHSSLLVLERWPARGCRHIKEILFPYKVYDFFQKWFIKVCAFDPILHCCPTHLVEISFMNVSFFFFFLPWTKTLVESIQPLYGYIVSYSNRVTSLHPLDPNISIHILHTVLYTFPTVLTRRIWGLICVLDSWVLLYQRFKLNRHWAFRT